LVSAYHAWTGLGHGDPTEVPTHWWRWQEANGYHIDYCFLPRSWVDALRGVHVGSYAAWGSAAPRSDHAPLVVDLDLTSLRRVRELREVSAVASTRSPTPHEAQQKEGTA
jgi:hypothetical protein